MSEQPSAIRVGLIYEETVVDERIVESPRPVSVGTEAGATLAVDTPDLPRQIALVDWHDGRYVLRVFPDMEGRLEVDGRLTTLETARLGAETDAEGAALIPLTDVSAGRVGFGDAVVMLQRTSPADRPERPALPAELKRGLTSGLDRRFGGAVAVAALLQIGVVVWAQVHAWPEPTETPISPRIQEFVSAEEMPTPPPEDIPEPEPPERADSEGNAPDDQTAGEESASTNEETETAEASNDEGASESESRNVAEAGVQEGTVLEALGSEGGEEMLADMETASPGDEMDEAIANARSHSPGDDRGELETGDERETGQTVDADDDLARAPGSREAENGRATGGPDEIGVRCTDCNGGSNGGPDDDAPVSGVGDVIERHAGRIQRCYERALKTDAELAGKLVVSFRIAPDGSPTALAATRDTVGGVVADCALGIFRRMSFPSRGSRTSTIDKTFVFEPAR